MVCYVDDFYIVGNSREELYSYIKSIKYFLINNLVLEINENKTWLHKQEEGVNFLGYMLKCGIRIMNKRSKKKMNKQLIIQLFNENNKLR